MKQVIKRKIIEKHEIQTEPEIKTLLLDMNSIMKMALVNKQVNARNEEVGMIFTTLLVIRNIIGKDDYNFCYAMYDGYNSGVKRFSLYPLYKQNRDKHYEMASGVSDYDKQIDAYVKKVLDFHKKNKKIVKRNETDDESFVRQREIVFKCLEELFIRNVMCDSVEGDDLIAYYVKNKKPNEKILIVSGDRDLTQLISDDVSIYVTQLKKIITKDNHLKEIGYTHENVVLKKVILGDTSDNVYGIKGVGETSFFKWFPKAITEKCTLEEIIERSKELLEERKAAKKKPLKALENIVNCVTDGCQGKEIYEINKKIIDLSNPLMTNEAEEELSGMMYAPIDPEDRGSKNLYKIILEHSIEELMDSGKFASFFSPFATLISNEKKYYGKQCLRD